MSSRISVIREQNVKQNLYNSWSEFQAKFLSFVMGMSSRVSVIRDRNVTQSFCHPWSECQAEFLSSVIGMSSRVSATREQKVKHNLYPPTKNTHNCRNFPVTVVLQYFNAISTKNTKTHNSPYPSLLYTRRPWNFIHTSTSPHFWHDTSLSVHFSQISLHILRCFAMWNSAKRISLPVLYHNRNCIRNTRPYVPLKTC